MTHKRLAIVAVLLLAGCAGPTEENIAIQVDSLSDRDVIDQTTVPANETIPAVRLAARTGTVTRSERRDNLADRTTVVSNGSYFAVERTAVDESNATRITYRITVLENGTAEYQSDELSSEDLETVATASILADEPGDEILEDSIYVNGTDLRRSVFVDSETTVVRYGTTLYRVEPIGREAVTQERYRYEADEVAATDTEYLEYVDRQYTVSLDSISQEGRTFFENVSSGNGYYYGEAGSGYDEIAEALPDETSSTSDYYRWDGMWFVSYNGERYVLSIADVTPTAGANYY